MAASDWDPVEYLRFEAERTRPSRDLVARIEVEAPKDIIDIGCGPGNSAKVLLERWPGASILGIDSSPAMIERARKERPEGSWEVADAAGFEAREAFDIVFSNAAIQWIPDHESLIPRLFGAVRPGGALAVQVPMFEAMPIYAAIRAVAGSSRWRAHLGSLASGLTFYDLDFYYDILGPMASKVDAWRTQYAHVMPSRSAIVDFVRSTGLRPYLDALCDDEERRDFLADLLAGIGEAYPDRADGKVLFPFDRLFFIASK